VDKVAGRSLILFDRDDCRVSETPTTCRLVDTSGSMVPDLEGKRD
jgi:hypothetical protein